MDGHVWLNSILFVLLVIGILVVARLTTAWFTSPYWSRSYRGAAGVRDG
jgi:hypothetical protein